MQNKLLKKFTVLFALGTILTSCGDYKTPLKGYISNEELNTIKSNFKDGPSEFNRYSVKGRFNYFDYPDSKMDREVNYTGILLDAPDYYIVEDDEKDDGDEIPIEEKPKPNSYYLRIPMRITPTSWDSEMKNDKGLSLATRYQLEAKVYRPEGLDSIYYYKREEGGFILRAFGVNKALFIAEPAGITSRGKWNIEAEYDKDGYLVREYFATVNASEKKKSECCYGEATYSFSYVNEEAKS
ncbi:MAG: hypothetical protein J1F31_06430 [Erysipelotrichales bacterium]|nr:hypothetical protein [Erysipelotrichales bacterium]